MSRPVLALVPRGAASPVAPLPVQSDCPKSERIWKRFGCPCAPLALILAEELLWEARELAQERGTRGGELAPYLARLRAAIADLEP